MGSLGRRLEALEGQLAQASGGVAEGRGAARSRMVAHLDRLAAIRRGAEASDEERAELAEAEKALKRRLVERIR